MSMGTLKRAVRPATQGSAPQLRSAAVVCVTPRDGVVARSRLGRDTLLCLERRLDESKAAFLSRIIREIGNRDRVAIIGPAPDRLELEKAYVAATHRPDRLIDVEGPGAVPTQALLDLVRILGGTAADHSSRHVRRNGTSPARAPGATVVARRSASHP